MTTDRLKPKRNRGLSDEPLFLCKIKKETNPFVRYSEKVFDFSKIMWDISNLFLIFAPRTNK